MNTHICRRLAHCDGHPRWMVIRAFHVDAPPQFSGRPWWVYRPGTDLTVGRFATHEEAVTYATTQAHTETTTTTKENK